MVMKNMESHVAQAYGSHLFRAYIQSHRCPRNNFLEFIIYEQCATTLPDLFVFLTDGISEMISLCVYISVRFYARNCTQCNWNIEALLLANWSGKRCRKICVTDKISYRRKHQSSVESKILSSFLNYAVFDISVERHGASGKEITFPLLIVPWCIHACWRFALIIKILHLHKLEIYKTAKSS